MATSVGGQLLSTLLKFVVRTVFIHTLGKSYLGINGLFSDILTMLSLTELGFDTAINFKLYKPLAQGDQKRVRVLMKFYKQAYRVVGTAILILGVCLIPLLPVLIRDYDTLHVLGINAVVIFLLHILRTVCSYWFFAYRSAIMKANQKKYILDLVDYAATIVNSIAEIFVLVFLKDFVLYTATVILFNILRNITNAVISKRYYPEFFEREPDKLSKEETFGLFKDCGALFVFRFNNVVLKATDNLVLSSFLGLAIVGVYSNYLLFFNTLRSLLRKLYVSVIASMGNLFATASVDKKYRFFEVMNYLTVVLYGTAAVGVAVCANELIALWCGENYVIQQPFSILIGVELLFFGLMNNLAQVRNVSGVFRQMWFRPVLGTIINLVVSIVLVQFCGIYGVILGTIISVVLSNFLVDPAVIHRYSFEKYKPVSAYYVKNIKYFVILAAVCAGDFLLCKTIFPGHGWFSLIIHVFIVGLSVPAAYVLLFWKSHECQYLRKLSQRILNTLMKKLKAHA